MQRYLLKILTIAFSLFIALPAYSLSAEAYTSTSRLAEGKWVKIKVKETGMQLLSPTFLRNLGFTNPEKVNVYGYGGRIISENLDDKQVDDLPLVPVHRTEKGILFFGHSNVRWTANRDTRSSGYYTHELNPYNMESCYFLSDCPLGEGETSELESATMSQPSGATAVIDRFVHRQFYEQELAAPSNTGRVLLGEDFRTQTQRFFSFATPDRAVDSVSIKVRFGARTTNASSSFQVSANGQQLPATQNDVMNAATNSEMFMRLATSVKHTVNDKDELNVGIKYNPGGVVTLARLDYIEVEYPRTLRLSGNELYFYTTLSGNSTFKLSGCTAGTQIWDVTEGHKPRRIDYQLQGSEATFTISRTGYCEFIAFNPDASHRSPENGGAVANQDIHGMAIPDMLIITPAEYMADAERLAAMHREDDAMTVHVLTPEALYNEFSSGAADVSAFRKALKMWYDRGREATEGSRLGYCMIYSRPTYDNRMITESVKNAGYPRVPIWQSATGTSHTTSYSTDFFIGMLEDTQGSFAISSEKVSISVGRLAVKSKTESADMTNKIIEFSRNPQLGAWRNNVMIIADDQDSNAHIKQAEDVYRYMRASGNGEDFLYNRLYLDAYPLESTGTGKAYVIPRQKLQQAFNDGVMFVNYIGHASPRGWGHEQLMPWTDIASMTNTKLPIIYSATCEFCRWDADEVSGAEVMWQYPTYGVIAFLSTSRTVYISNNGRLNNAMSSRLFERNAQGRAKRIGDVMTDGLNGMGADDNKLRYLVLGDPAMRLPSPEYRIVVDEINGYDMHNPGDDLPVIPARGRAEVKGHILDYDGNPATDFTGVIHPTLYDAERVVETLGNGDDGTPTMYNDHKTRLFTGRAEVKEGQWTATIMMPSEIDNNYSPALLSLYAYSNEGIEANGHTNSLYVYGFEDSETEDFEGPSISDFYINSPEFADGDVISTSGIVFATLEDASGINVSESGIGHQLSITIDDKKVYDDVAQYYEADSADPTKGKIVYLLTDLEPGTHTARLTAWDNANNSGSAELTFKVAANRGPQISNLTTDVNPASTGVTFIIDHDRPGQTLTSLIEVFDLSGKKVWDNASTSASGIDGRVNMTWNLTDYSSMRVPRGIYLYRATVKTSDGRTSTETKKLAVTAP